MIPISQFITEFDVLSFATPLNKDNLGQYWEIMLMIEGHATKPFVMSTPEEKPTTKQILRMILFLCYSYHNTYDLSEQDEVELAEVIDMCENFKKTVGLETYVELLDKNIHAEVGHAFISDYHKPQDENHDEGPEWGDFGFEE